MFLSFRTDLVSAPHGMPAWTSDEKGVYPSVCQTRELSQNRRNICPDFYSASALLAMQSAVLARGILSVRLSVRPSVTFRCFVQTNEDTIVQFSASGRTIPLVSGEVKFIRIFAGYHPILHRF